MKGNIYRDLYIGELSSELEGKEIRIAGWIEQIRNLGTNLMFLLIRDETGTVQVICNNPEKFNGVTRESTITLSGKIAKRTKEMINPNMKTGDIEIELTSFEILGKCASNLPFEINHPENASEETRLKYRYLDLRNEKHHNTVLFRSKVIDYIRSLMKEMGFTEIATPIITTSSPEGARDFVIPSRNYKGKFYALPQAPQIYKQLLMVSGFNKYFQIAPCFRDEDCRADRTLEFYQLDLEMSFATEEDVYAVGEKVFYNVFKTFGGKKVSPYPFRRIAYKDAMLNYGSDKPDLRNPLIIKDATNILSKMDFAPFNGKMIRVIKTENMDKSNSWYKQVEEFIKGKGASGLATIKVAADGTFKSSLDKFMIDEIRTELKEEYELKAGDALFILADEPKKCPKLAGALRTHLGEELNLINKDKFEFCIVNDFPMYEENEETGAIDFGHNPFSMPKGGLESLNNEDPLNITAIQYDFVCNGYEMSSGAVRNHDIEIMKKAFEIAGYDEEVIKNKFRSLYTAFQFGAPPHAGMAPGIDRIIMLLTGEDNLREVQIFPPNVSGVDLLMGGPIELEEKQLRELHIKVRD
ncbi:MAG: aspartate--tRNA ligase [bacterium]|nr:aspartate--tRNA ligase [bacterium]